MTLLMEPFTKFFPESDLQSGDFFKIMRNEEELGFFKLIQMYCPDPSCNCQKVLITFLEVINQKSRFHAALSYGWGSVPFYQEWGLTKKEALELKEGYLEPFSPQLKYAQDLLEAFQSRIKEDQQFLEKLKLHYAMVKGKSAQKAENKNNVIPFRPRI